ncbi:MAG TPA: SDR family oxidoreductase [Candidatus Thermoplasmatota archaeon]|nr:SDR family oxidoreductase [Candidatus Thermoplasmatota archaeon]
MQQLDGVALVTGAAKRIGAAIALRLARAGCDVVVHHRASTPEAEAVCQRIRALGRKAWAVQADLAVAQDRERLLEDAQAAAGAPVRHLVNNASSFPRTTLETMDRAGFHAALDVDAWAPFELTRRLHAAGCPAGVVTVLDARLHDPDPNRISYHLAKRLSAELVSLAARRYAPLVRVNGVAPGPVLAQVDAPAGAPGPSGKGLPLQRPPSPEDIADATAFLLGSQAITGTVVPVDGGRHLVGPALPRGASET